MFALAYVLLPFSDQLPADALRAALAPFQRGGRSDLPDSLVAFDDETEALRRLHAARLTFTEQDTSGLRIEGDAAACWTLDTEKIRAEMCRLGLRRWSVCFADELSLAMFVTAFCRCVERHPETDRFGAWRNPLGRWDWWDLGGRFDGYIIGDPARAAVRPVAPISSGENPGRTLLANLEDRLADSLGQAPFSEVDVLSSRNVELVATLLADARAGRENACPGALVLPPGATVDGSRWLDAWPAPGPPAAFTWLGLPPDAGWPEVARAAYARFQDHWAAGVAYHC